MIEANYDRLNKVLTGSHVDTIGRGCHAGKLEITKENIVNVHSSVSRKRMVGWMS